MQGQQCWLVLPLRHPGLGAATMERQLPEPELESIAKGKRDQKLFGVLCFLDFYVVWILCFLLCFALWFLFCFAEAKKQTNKQTNKRPLKKNTCLKSFGG